MKSLTTKMLVAMVAVFVFLSGCSNLQKPNVEVQQELIIKSFKEMVYATDMSKLGMIETPHHGFLSVKDIGISDPEFLSKSAPELVKDWKDKNGIKRAAWKIEIDAKTNVQYVLDFVNTDEIYCRKERAKYEVFIYEKNKGEYAFENGALENFETEVAG